MPRVVPSDVVALIDRMFPGAATEEPQAQTQWGIGQLGTIAALVDLVRELPEELLSVAGEKYLGLLAGVSALRAAVQAWQGGNTGFYLARLQGFQYTPVTLIRRALAACPDQFPSKDTNELAFVPDNTLREGLRLDISSANQALSNGNWKAATVLAGSVVEALLLWALQERGPAEVKKAIDALLKKEIFSRAPQADLATWHLHEYIEVAAELGVVKAQTANQARLAKDFRNLIHPGLEARRGQMCDRGTALSAVAAVEHVARDLSP